MFLNAAILAIGIIFSLILTGLISRPIIRLKNFAQSINQDNLNQRILISTKDEIEDLAISINNMLESLLQAKNQLVEASHAAGVAEVATSILHNVGNVLNSINTSTAILLETANQLSSENIKKIYNLLEEHQSNLFEFLQSEQGMLILPYLQKLSQQVENDNHTLKAELIRLQDNLQHVNNVIAMQQVTGRSKGLEEKIVLQELIKSACLINQNKLEKTGIKIIYNFEDVSPVMSVKAKLQHILINLIKNSIESLLESKNQDKQIMIKLGKTADKIQIYIIDNGIGIPKENLTKIFSFGFTTKADGHGYGVHNSALVARELGGQLIAMSEGQEKGATFLLELPLK